MGLAAVQIQHLPRPQHLLAAMGFHHHLPVQAQQSDFTEYMMFGHELTLGHAQPYQFQLVCFGQGDGGKLRQVAAVSPLHVNHYA